jgi:hypothetical protein
MVAGSCKYGYEPSGFRAADLVSYVVREIKTSSQ